MALGEWRVKVVRAEGFEMLEGAAGEGGGEGGDVDGEVLEG